MAIPLPTGSSPLFTDSRIGLNYQLTLSLAYNISAWTVWKAQSSIVFLCLLLRERVYRVVAQKRPCYIHPSRGRCIATPLHAKISEMILLHGLSLYWK
jgi:hypothetical protein